MDQIEEDDENGFYVEVLLAVRGANKEELDANTAVSQTPMRKHFSYRLFLTTISKFRH